MGVALQDSRKRDVTLSSRVLDSRCPLLQSRFGTETRSSATFVEVLVRRCWGRGRLGADGGDCHLVSLVL